MKLLRCHIHNFGKLSQLDIDFNQNPYAILKDNGEGKTTLLNFILAMLYGLDAANARSKEESLRELYYPYNNSQYGGSLELEKGKNKYRIERTFDKKSSVKDVNKIYVNDKEVDIDIAKDVIGIDETSFLKTLYYRNNDFDLSTPDSLTNNIIKLDSASSLSSNFNKALESLTKIEKNYSKNSDFGIIKGLDKSIQKAMQKKLEIDYSEDELLSLKNNRTDIEEELIKLNKEKELINTYELIKTKGEAKQKAQEQLDNLNKENNGILAKYNSTIIEVSDISELRRYHDSYISNNNEIKNTSLDKEEEELYLDLDFLFKKNPLTKEELEDIKEKENSLIKLEERINNISIENNAEEKEIIELFEEKELSEEDLANIDEYLNHYQNAFNNISNASIYNQPVKKNNALTYILFILSALLVIGGIALLFFYLIPGIALLSTGVILLIVSIIVLFKSREINNTSSDLYHETNKMKEYEEKLRQYTVKYQIYSLNIINDVNLLKNKYNMYLDIKEKAESSLKEKEAISEEYQSIKKELELIKNKYLLNDNIYFELNTKYTRHNELNNKFISIQNKLASLKDANQTLENEFNEIKNKYKLDITIDDKEFVNKIDSYKDDLQKYNTNLSQIKYWTNEYSQYEEDDIDTSSTSIREKEEVENDIKEKEQLKNSLNNRIKELENNKQLIDSLDRQINENNEKLNIAREEDRIYQATIEALINTNNLIISKYIDPIKNDFVKYASKIEELIGQSVHLTSNFELQFLQEDSLRSYNHLSLGEKTIAGMVLRLSFIEQLFKEDKPFLLLDDPFTDLDPKHLDKALKFLKEISKDMQIIYITCHPSRMLK